MLNPATDKRLSPPEREMYLRVYPVIQKIEDEFGVEMSSLVASNMVRRAVTRGASIDDLINELRYAAKHQAEHNAALRGSAH